MYGCESWIIKKAESQRIDAFELWCWRKTLQSPLDCKEIKPVNPKGNRSWLFITRTDAEAEAPKLWLPDAKSQLIGKDPDAGKDWGQEKGVTEDEMVGPHHWLTGHEFEQALGDSEGQGSLACCSPWGLKESDPTEWLNNKDQLSTLSYLGPGTLAVLGLRSCERPVGPPPWGSGEPTKRPFLPQVSPCCLARVPGASYSLCAVWSILCSLASTGPGTSWWRRLCRGALPCSHLTGPSTEPTGLKTTPEAASWLWESPLCGA